MNPLRTSIYWRVLVWFLLANLVVLLLGGYLTQRFIDYSTAVEIDWAALARDANQNYESGGAPALDEWVRQQQAEGIRATLYEDGHPLSPIRLPPPVHEQLPDLLRSGHDMLMRPRRGLYLDIQQVDGDAGHVRQLVALSRSHTHLRRQTRDSIELGVMLGLSLLFIGLIGWWVARGVARPVEALRDATRRMATGELSTRVGPQGRATHDELAQLALDFDAMAERIEALVAHDRRVLQDLSHELRSPLARLHLILDLARRSDDPQQAAAYFDQAEQEIERLDQMTGQMLALSRLEGGIPGMPFESVDLADVVMRCVAQSGLEAAARGVQLTLTSSVPAVVFGSGELIERALDNLLGNAIKFSPEGGHVDIALDVDQEMAVITVRDHGPGVPEDELDSLFRPFFRGHNATRAEGHGLGLAIVMRVMKGHGGDIRASNREGAGLEVQLRLPLQRHDFFGAQR